jgi:hypothetical protein
VLGVTLAHELLGAPLPEGLLPSANSAANRGRSNTDGRAVRRLLDDVLAALPMEVEATVLATLAFQCRTRDTLADRARYCAEILAAPHVADVEWISLPRPLRWLYYLARPARLVAKRMRRVLHR